MKSIHMNDGVGPAFPGRLAHEQHADEIEVVNEVRRRPTGDAVMLEPIRAAAARAPSVDLVTREPLERTRRAVCARFDPTVQARSYGEALAIAQELRDRPEPEASYQKISR